MANIDTVWRDRPTKDPATWTGMDKAQQVFEYRLRALILQAKSGKLSEENKATLKRVIRAWGVEKARNPSADPKTTECVTPTGAASCDAVLSVVEGSYTGGWYGKYVANKSTTQKVIMGVTALGVAGLAIYAIDRTVENAMINRRFPTPRITLGKK